MILKEWYLTTPQPNITSGYEGDAITEYAQNNFADVLETFFSDTVILYNASLTESKKIQCVVQGNTADTQLKSMERCILAPIGTLHSGDYIYYEDEYWIIDGRPGNNKSYEKATMKECQYQLRWQKDDGTVVERWANLTTTTNDVGEAGNTTIILSSGTISIIIPHDADSMTIENKRVFIDTSDTPKKVFKITRNNDALFVHGNHGGTLSLMADKTELNTNADRPDLRLCDYIDSNSPLPPQPLEPVETPDLTATISGNTNLRNNYKRTYTVQFSDKEGNETDWNIIDFDWCVMADFEVQKNIYENKIDLSVNNEDVIDSSFLLQIIVDDKIITEIKIYIRE